MMRFFLLYFFPCLEISIALKGCSERDRSREVREKRNRIFAEHKHEHVEPVFRVVSNDPVGDVRYLKENIFPRYWACPIDELRITSVEEPTIATRLKMGSVQASQVLVQAGAKRDNDYDIYLIQLLEKVKADNSLVYLELKVATCRLKLDPCRDSFAKATKVSAEWSLHARTISFPSIKTLEQPGSRLETVENVFEDYIPKGSVVGIKILSEVRLRNEKYVGGIVWKINA